MRARARARLHSPQHSTEYELLEALARPVCVVCDRAREASGHYVAGILREGVNDPSVRDAWRRRGGLCARHWHVFRSQESPPLPAAILTEDLLDAHLASQRVPGLDCPACEIERIAERRYLNSLVGIERRRLEATLERGRGFVCLRHLAEIPPGGVRDLFEERVHQLLAELKEFRRKQDYRFADEPAGVERDSWLRAIRALGGDV